MKEAQDLVRLAKDIVADNEVSYWMNYSEWRVHLHENHPHWAAMERHIEQKCQDMADEAGQDCLLRSPTGKIQMVIKPQHRMASSKVAWGGREVFPRSFYIPKDAPNLKQLDEGKDLGLEFWSYEDEKGGIYGMAFWGKANKPLWHYRFRDMSQFEKKVRETIDSRKSHVDRIEQRRQERVQYKHNLKVGDILISSWGYDQTNIDFYEVVEVGEKSVKIREIDGRTLPSNEPSQDKVVPAPGRYKGPVMTKMVGTGDSVKVRSFAWAHKWDGTPAYQTAFGYGH